MEEAREREEGVAHRNTCVGANVCRVGGYENTLLGYRTKLHKDLLESNVMIDIYLFGESTIGIALV